MKTLKLTTPTQSNEIDWNKTQYLIKKNTDKESPTIILFRADWWKDQNNFSGIIFPCLEYPTSERSGIGWKSDYELFTGKAILEIFNT